MNILIKGMDMPKGCDETCPLYLAGQCCEGCDCPLIEIPTPHGRLIDENDVKAKCVNEVFDKMGTVAITETYFGDEWADDICDVPTILEAER